MLACRLKDPKVIHVLMRAEANVLKHAGEKGEGGGKRTALHWCALHGSEEECKVLADYVKDSGGDSLRMQRYLEKRPHNTLSQQSLSICPINPLSQSTLSTYPLKLPSQPTLSTPPLNPPTPSPQIPRRPK